jgi:hypothetical protein
MNKITHSKFKNTGILFELLVRQIASDTVSGKDSAAINIIKKYFNKTELAKEHKLYQILVTPKSINESKAEIFINSTLDASLRLNKSTLRKEKYNLIKEIRDNYNLEDFFKAKITNYTQYAAVYNLIEAHSSSTFISPQLIINNKITLLEHITRKEVNKDELKDRILEEYAQMDKGTRLLAYRVLLEKFNKKYSTLDSRQKTILKEFINNISNTVELKEFINKKYVEVRAELSQLVDKVLDKTTQIKLNEVVNLIIPIEKNQNVKDENVISLLQYCQLINELKNIK